MTVRKAPVASEHTCQGKNKHGQPCGAGVRTGAAYCFHHDPARADQVAAARKLGGRNRSKPAPADPIDLSTPDLQRRAIEQTIDRIRRGDETLSTAKVVLYAISLARPIVEAVVLEERIKALEEAKGARL